MDQQAMFSGEVVDYASAKVVMFGAPMDITTTFKKGTANGPASIREASLQIETYVASREIDFFERNPLHDMGDIQLSNGSVEKNLAIIEDAVTKIVKDKPSDAAASHGGKKPFMLGGEHLVVLGAVKSFAKNGNNFVLLQFDAHSDLRDSYQDRTLSHTTVMRRAFDYIDEKNLMQVGIRSLPKEDFEFIKSHGIKSLMMHNYVASKWKKAIEEFTKGKRVYITFDIDAFDAPLVPATGCPEPGGLDYWQVVELLDCIKGEIIGCDVVETAPDANYITQSTAAKLCYELLARM